MKMVKKMLISINCDILRYSLETRQSVVWLEICAICFTLGCLNEKWKKLTEHGRNAAGTSVFFSCFWMTLKFGTCQTVSTLEAYFHKIHDFIRRAQQCDIYVTLSIVANRPHSFFRACIPFDRVLKQSLQLSRFPTNITHFEHFTIRCTFYREKKNTETNQKIERMIVDSINYLSFIAVYLCLFNDFNCHPFWSCRKVVISSLLISFSDIILN